MSTRLQGWLLEIGAIGVIVTSLLIIFIPGRDGYSGPEPVPTNAIFVLSGICLLVGLPGLHRAQSQKMRTAGLVAVVLLWAATICLIILSVAQIVEVASQGSIPQPAGKYAPPTIEIITGVLGNLLMLIGGVMMGIKIIWAHVLPSAAGWIILLSAILSVVGFALPVTGFLSDIVQGVVFTLLSIGIAWAGASIGSHENLA